jgi:hypothetical protein
MIYGLLGALITIALFLSHFVAFKFGCKRQIKVTADKLSKEEEEALQRQIKGIENVLNYDYDAAIGKRVNR